MNEQTATAEVPIPGEPFRLVLDSRTREQALRDWQEHETHQVVIDTREPSPTDPVAEDI